MNLVVRKSSALHGSVHIPPNKSHSFRALIMASLAEGPSRIHRPAVSHDWMLATEALEMFGSEITPRAEHTWEIAGTAGQLQVPEDVVNCGNSGITLRFFAALAGTVDGYTVLTGDHSLRFIRPCQPLMDAMNRLGAWAVCAKGDGHAPLLIRGRLAGGSTEIDGMDSQPVSALLIASALADAPTELIVHNPGEKPWVGVTLHWLEKCGVDFSHEGFEKYRMRGRGRWQGFEETIPLDWSAALYPIAAALLTPDSEVRIPGMDLQDPQGDKQVLEILRNMGGDIQIEEDGTIVARSSELTGCEIDCNDFIDQFMLLAVIGACAEGETVLTNAAICRQKECDRITEMAKALTTMGAEVSERPDGLVIHHSRLKGASLNSRGDHRMVMTLAVAGLVADGYTCISNIECVRKTFSDFPEQMLSLGCDLEKQR
ncbi:MAG: 3-phosphoshikimate 1-carboxyvinyltransferase [Phycisphaerae bacterium]